MSDQTTIVDPHAPVGEQEIKQAAEAATADESPLRTAMRNADAATEIERIQAASRQREQEQAQEDVVNRDIQRNTAEQKAQFDDQIEAAIDDAIEMARIREGRFRHSTIDVRRRRAIHAVLTGQVNV